MLFFFTAPAFTAAYRNVLHTFEGLVNDQWSSGWLVIVIDVVGRLSCDSRFQVEKLSPIGFYATA